MKKILEVKEVEKHFSQASVLKGISVDIYQEDFTVIMGSSGSGKSTFLYCISGMDSPTKGCVHLLGEDIVMKKEKELAELRRRNMGFVFQQMNLLPSLTLLENIVTPGYLIGRKKEEVKEAAMNLLERFEIADLSDRLPNQISGGQLQRASIARALINEPELVFADEPTGALNSSSGQAVLDILTEFNTKEKQSILMVTHDIKAAIRANRIIYLNDGQIKGELKLEGYVDSRGINDREKHVLDWLSEMGW
ncbi:ABC transporter ATP-binding protein [Enterococcus sp. AZ163]|uniref:ABC transporter ATP-binding protein n=1 Tax=Enterococcus sp. AZ163 TaxID=2774638 RepID=UPI003D2891B6